MRKFVQFAASAVGPGMVSAGVWCALGHITAATAARASVRVAVPASAWWLAITLVLAWFVPAWRRYPWRASPALLATIAWWPIPIGATALLWTGRLAWVPLLLAGSAAFGDRPQAAQTSSRVQADAVPLAAAAGAGALTLVVAVLVAWSVAPHLPGGDEPNYLVITQSLLEDGDLKIQNNFERRDYAAYYPGTLKPDFIQKGVNHEIYSIHAPGLPFLVLPGFAAFGYRGAQGTVVVLAACTGSLLWLIGWLATGDRRAAWFAWAAIAGSSTFLIQSVTIFPDLPAAAIVAAATLTVVAFSRRPSFVRMPALVGMSVLLSLLPWLHTRFAVLAAGCGALIALEILREGTRPASERWRRVVAFLAIPLAGAVAWFVFFWMVYGTPNPAAPYGTTGGDTRVIYAPGGVLGLLFDSGFGLFAYAPVLAAAVFAAFDRKARRLSRPGVWIVVISALYLVAVGVYWQWWAGTPAPPARFAAAILPAFAIPLAALWTSRGPIGRACLSLALAATLVCTMLLLGFDRGALLWNVRAAPVEWVAFVRSGANLARALPNFFWGLTPGDVRTEWLFAAHVGLVLVVAAAVAAVISLLARRPAIQRESRLTSAWAFAAVAMIAAPAGWQLLGVRGIQSEGAGFDVMRAVADGGRPLRLAPFAVSRRAAPSLVSVLVDRSDHSGSAPPPWDALADVPAGTYAIRVIAKTPVAGTMAFRAGRSVQPFGLAELAAVAEQVLTVAVPLGVSRLEIEPDPALAHVIQSIAVSPVTLASPSPGFAERSAPLGTASLFFYDDNVYEEGAAFWVKGGAATRVAIVAPGRSAVSVTFANGGVINTVGVDVSGSHQDIVMAAGAARTIEVPVPASDAVDMRIQSAAHFRPSDVSASADHRDLGVRVVVAPGQ